jgi:hypothetical protein
MSDMHNRPAAVEFLSLRRLFLQWRLRQCTRCCLLRLFASVFISQLAAGNFSHFLGRLLRILRHGKSPVIADIGVRIVA